MSCVHKREFQLPRRRQSKARDRYTYSIYERPTWNENSSNNNNTSWQHEKNSTILNKIEIVIMTMCYYYAMSEQASEIFLELLFVYLHVFK